MIKSMINKKNRYNVILQRIWLIFYRVYSFILKLLAKFVLEINNKKYFHKIYQIIYNNFNIK